MPHMNNDLAAEQLKVIEKVEKLMKLAAKNPNAEEAASATAKAQALLVAYNLSAELVGNVGSSADAKGEKQKIKGGMYSYQRDLWRSGGARGLRRRPQACQLLAWRARRYGWAGMVCGAGHRRAGTRACRSRL